MSQMYIHMQLSVDPNYQVLKEILFRIFPHEIEVRKWNAEN